MLCGGLRFQNTVRCCAVRRRMVLVGAVWYGAPGASERSYLRSPLPPHLFIVPLLTLRLLYLLLLFLLPPPRHLQLTNHLQNAGATTHRLHLLRVPLVLVGAAGVLLLYPVLVLLGHVPGEWVVKARVVKVALNFNILEVPVGDGGAAYADPS